MSGDTLCRKGLHDRPPGTLTCVPCKRIANHRYDISPKGAAAHRGAYQRYAYSTKGILRNLSSQTRRAERA